MILSAAAMLLTALFSSCDWEKEWWNDPIYHPIYKSVVCENPKYYDHMKGTYKGLLVVRNYYDKQILDTVAHASVEFGGNDTRSFIVHDFPVKHIASFMDNKSYRDEFAKIKKKIDIEAKYKLNGYVTIEQPDSFPRQYYGPLDIDVVRDSIQSEVQDSLFGKAVTISFVYDIVSTFSNDKDVSKKKKDYISGGGAYFANEIYFLCRKVSVNGTPIPVHYDYGAVRVRFYENKTDNEPPLTE